METEIKVDERSEKIANIKIIAEMLVKYKKELNVKSFDNLYDLSLEALLKVKEEIKNILRV
jgi:hypothetical protein